MSTNQGRQYHRSVEKLAEAANAPEQWATAILARLAQDPDPWILVGLTELEARHELTAVIEAADAYVLADDQLAAYETLEVDDEYLRLHNARRDRRKELWAAVGRWRAGQA